MIVTQELKKEQMYQRLELKSAEEAFSTEIVNGTNCSRFESSIIVKKAMEAFRMPAGFHARKCSVSKEYRYRLRRGRTLSPLDAPFAVRISSEVDLVALQQATLLLVGRHDFTAFALAGGGHGQPFRRILSAQWKESGDELELRIVGDGFLRGMVRSIVGTLLEVGRGRISKRCRPGPNVIDRPYRQAASGRRQRRQVCSIASTGGSYPK